MSLISSINSSRHSRVLWALIWAVGFGLGFAVYTIGIGSNPPGFFVDESANAYNAFLVSTTAAGEVGPKFPLYFQFYTDDFAQWGNPTQIYLLAAAFFLFGPGIILARLVAAACAFGACILLGRLAYRVSGNAAIGFIVGGTALLTPWLFEVGRLVLDPFFYPVAVVLFLWAVFSAQKKERWGRWDILFLVVSLVLLTYSYTIGRLLAPLLALGLAILITNRERLISVLLTWAGFAVTLIPLVWFAREHPDLSRRFYLISYIRKTSTYTQIVKGFIPRFIEDLNPWSLLWIGDANARHHVPHSLGSIYFATFIFAMIGIAVIIVRHRTNRWWLFIVFGYFASIVPGALTWDHAHTLRMIAYPVFLFMLTIPAIEWFLGYTIDPEKENDGIKHKGTDDGEDISAEGHVDQTEGRIRRWLVRFIWQPKRAAAFLLIVLTLVQAGYFHIKNFNEGPRREFEFDASYKKLYDLAVAQPERPIYLFDDAMGPSYIHALWYASIEGRDAAEFNHIFFTDKPPPGSLVLSTEPNCKDCDLIAKEDRGILYRTMVTAANGEAVQPVSK